MVNGKVHIGFYSNTTLVKVKLNSLYVFGQRLRYSNTTLVKVKLEYTSNTTSPKEIQIQHLLKLNRRF